MLQSPLTKMTVHLSNWQAIAIVGLLANPCTASTMRRSQAWERGAKAEGSGGVRANHTLN
jgi:hypothetical protein